MGTAVYLAAGLIIGELASQNRRHRAKAEELASEQAALRRVATLVAKGVSEGKVFAAVAKEVGSLADASAAQISVMSRTEAVANAVKHASASAAEVEVRIDNEALCVHVRDNGTGGANPARGSGIVGLRDRVEALGGRLMLASPRGTRDLDARRVPSRCTGE